MNNVIIAFGMTLMAGLATAIGSMMVLFTKKFIRVKMAVITMKEE